MYNFPLNAFIQTCSFVPDDVQTVQWMKERFPLKDEAGQMPNVVQATVNDSPEMLQLLLSKPSGYGLTDSNNMSTCSFAGHTALDIAILLGLKQCEDILLRFNIPFARRERGDVASVNLLTSMTSTRYNRTELMRKAIHGGCDVNVCAEVNGHRIPLFYDAILKADIELIKVFLANGAVLFNEKDITKLGCPPRLLGEYIYHNLDISTEEGSVITDILEGKKKREKLLYLVLHTAHTISRKDRDKLSELCQDINFYGRDRVLKFLNEPRALTVLSRNSIRKHYAHKIHDFLDQTVLPPTLREFISLKDKLSVYLDHAFSFTTEVYADLSNNIFPMDYDSD